MGLLTGLLTLPLAPVRGVVWVAEKVEEAAEREYYDPTRVEQALKELEQELVSGRIDQETFEAREEQLLDRLEEIQLFWEAKQA